MKKRKHPHIWVIETARRMSGPWTPTPDTSQKHRDLVEITKEWRMHSSDCVRIAKYVREQP